MIHTPVCRSANVVHARHDADVACSSCSVSHRQNY